MPRAVSKPVRICAPAKINLFLTVCGRLKTGYHHLRSLMTFCDVGEWVEVSPAQKDHFELEGPEADALKAADQAMSNSVIEARDAFRKQFDVRDPVSLTLHKAMPTAAGIGGGSSDAAATLKALKAYFGPEASLPTMLDVCASLGADVPACYVGEPVFLDGVGREIVPVRAVMNSAYILLVNPRVSVSTPAVFKALKAQPYLHKKSHPKDMWTLQDVAAESNDMEKAARALAPEITKVLAALETTKGHALVRMSGSGATCFALYTSQADLDAAHAYIHERHPSWWCAASNTKT